MQTKNKRLRFMQPDGLSKGLVPIMGQSFQGTLPDGVYASWRLILSNGEEKSGKRLSGDYFIPAFFGTLLPNQTITLEIECDSEDDIATPTLTAFVKSQDFFYLPSKLAPVLPPEIEAMIKDPREREMFVRQVEMQRRPQTSDEIDPTRVEIVDDKSMTIAHYKSRIAELGQPAAAMLELEVQPNGLPKSNLIFLQ